MFRLPLTEKLFMCGHHLFQVNLCIVLLRTKMPSRLFPRCLRTQTLLFWRSNFNKKLADQENKMSCIVLNHAWISFLKISQQVPPLFCYPQHAHHDCRNPENRPDFYGKNNVRNSREVRSPTAKTSVRSLILPIYG